eukprot:78621_1
MDQMFRMLSIALCSISCTSAHIDQTTCSYPTTPACDKYVYISDTVARTRDEADTLCFSHKYGGLATISSEDDLECALSTIGDGNARPWIGLMSYMEPESGDWHQMDGTPCPLRYHICYWFSICSIWFQNIMMDIHCFVSGLRRRHLDTIRGNPNQKAYDTIHP